MTTTKSAMNVAAAATSIALFAIVTGGLLSSNNIVTAFTVGSTGSINTKSLAVKPTTISTILLREVSTTTKQSYQQSSPLYMSSSSEDEVTRLRAAAAKAREEVTRLQKEFGKTVVDDGSSTRSSSKKVSSIELKETIVPTIVNEDDLLKQNELWTTYKKDGIIQQFGSANLRTYPVSLQMLESRTSINAEAIFGNGLPEVNLDDFKYATLWVTGISTVLAIGSLAVLPANIGATLCYAFALIPILFLGIGSSAPGVIADAIARVRTSMSSSTDEGSEDKPKDVSLVERRIRHEAAHFCCGYWCGLPVQSYTVSQNTGTSSNEYSQVVFATAPASSKGYSQTQIAALAVTALSGVVGEVLQYKFAESSAIQDLLLLDTIFKQSEQFIGSASQQDLTRWGALVAATLLQTNKVKYEQIVTAFTEQKSIPECISILES